MGGIRRQLHQFLLVCQEACYCREKGNCEIEVGDKGLETWKPHHPAPDTAGAPLLVWPLQGALGEA